MQQKWNFIYLLLLIVGLAACTPKTTEPISTPTPPKPTTPAPEAPKLSPCPNFSDAPSQDDAETNYVLYRDFLKAQDYEQSYSYWKKVYQVSPAADGQRNTVFSDGIFFYEHFLHQTQDSAYVDSIFMLYDHLEECYPEGGYVNGRKAFDYYYKYDHLKSKKEIFELFKKSIDADDLKTNDFVINPFTALLTDLYESKEVPYEEARYYDEKIRAIIAYGLDKCKGVYCERWKIVEEYAPLRLQYFETVKDFYNCDYYVDKYYPKFEANPDSCDVVREVLSRLAWGGCTEGNTAYEAVKAVASTTCRQAGTGLAAQAYACLESGDYNCAIDKLKQAAEEETEVERKSALLMLTAKIYYVHKRNYPRARQYALQAADIRKNWGDPYILIGRMYASSGPLCGPGRGWDSQIVVWPAIDMWNKARSVDPSVAAEARRWINQYSQYMPKKEDIFIRNLNAGDNHFVPCWIQRNTKIRTAD